MQESNFVGAGALVGGVRCWLVHNVCAWVVVLLWWWCLVIGVGVAFRFAFNIKGLKSASSVDTSNYLLHIIAARISG